MKAPGVRQLFCGLLLTATPGVLPAQFYPDSLANWCLYRNVSPDGEYYVMHMLGDPDTLINGQVYKRIDQITFGPALALWYPRTYVRSSSDGKGYLYLLELDQEFLTGDLTVGVGDTVHDVLMADETMTCPNVLVYNLINVVLTDVVIQGIDTITNGGVTVVRYQVWPLCSGTFDPLFWQKGIGTAHGPVLALTIGLAHVDLHHASVGDTCYYNWSTLPMGLPGGPECCVFIENGVTSMEKDGVFVHPVPSSGLFQISGSAPDLFRVTNAQGDEVLRGQGSQIDLSGHPQGLYILVITAEHTMQSVRLILAQ